MCAKYHLVHVVAGPVNRKVLESINTQFLELGSGRGRFEMSSHLKRPCIPSEPSNTFCLFA